jgi:hypothetical protein
MNVSSGDKLIGCAALSAAFISGIKAFGMDSTKPVPLLMPVLKLSYNEIVSGAKIKILKTNDRRSTRIISFSRIIQFSVPHISTTVGCLAWVYVDTQKKSTSEIVIRVLIQFVGSEAATIPTNDPLRCIRDITASACIHQQGPRIIW